MTVSTPGIFLNALYKFKESSPNTNNGPFFNLYLLPLTFAFPGLNFLLSTTLYTSSYKPNLFNNSTASLVLETLFTSLSNTNGT